MTKRDDIHHALKYLSENNSLQPWDKWLGDALARMESLSDASMARGWHILQGYQPKLVEAGFTIPMLADTEPERLHVNIVDAGNELVLNMDRHPGNEIVQQLSRLRRNTNSAGWNGKEWHFGKAARVKLESIFGIGYEGSKKSIGQHMLDSLAYETNPPIVPFQHQYEDTLIALKSPYKGYLFCYQRGVGKTLPALISAKAHQSRILVVANVSAKENWYREAKKIGADIEVVSWAKIPEQAEEPFVFIADEFHHGKSFNASLRSKRMVELAKNKYCVAFYGLSGSPFPNGRAWELFAPLTAVGHWLVNDQRVYERRYCEGKHLHDGLRNPTELRKAMSDVLSYRRKADCLDLPPLIREPVKVEPDEDTKKIYQQEFSKLKTEHDERVRQGLTTNKADYVVMLDYLRHAGERAKMDSTIALASEAIAQKEKVLIATCYVDVAEALATKLNAGLITGKVSGEERQRIIDRLYDGNIQSIVMTYGSGGESLNIQAASTVILNGRTWVPKDSDQIEGRIDRIGQEHATTSLWIRFGAIDDKVDMLLLEKVDNINAVLDGTEPKADRFTWSVEELAEELIRQIFE